MFLEELETGAIECHVSDASGEEYLEYSWEPVGSTTRDYLDNPRLIPENAPNPSVVAPEAPVYDTLESFRSGETTFRYRYRLTAMSRATGLSSHAEVEVFVSSSRPSVYCPLEIVVEEGSNVVLDCEGVDPLSGRMDYEEDGASIEWEWEGLWGTSTGLLKGTDLSSPLFTAPPGSAGEEYHYIASMTSSASGMPRTARRRVTVKVTGAEEGTQAAADASALESAGEALGFTCSYNISLNEGYSWNVICIFSGAHRQGKPTMVFTTHAGTPDNTLRWWGSEIWDYDEALMITYGYSVTFRPTIKDFPETTTFRYKLTGTAADGSKGHMYITATVIDLNGGLAPVVTCNNPDPVYEGEDDLSLACTVEHPRSDQEHSWTGTDIANRLTDTDTLTPTFSVPDNVDANTDYDYTVTLSASGIDDVTKDVTVTVLNKPAITVTCEDPDDVDEGASDIALDCEALGAPGDNPDYTWSWSPTDNLTDHDTGRPTFDVPDDVDQDTTYTYTVTASADNAEDGTAEVTVTVKNPVSASVTCSDVEVYEATDDFTLNCIEFYVTVSGDLEEAISTASTTYSWTARGSTPDTDRLSATNIENPTFDVPDAVESNETYEYTFKISGPHFADATDDITVTVLEKPDITVMCEDSSYEVDEGDTDIELECEASGAPGGDPQYTWSWSPIDKLTGHDTATPTFAVPSDVERHTTYSYTATATAEDADDGTAVVTVKVRDLGLLACNDSEAYEATADFTLDCSVRNEPAGATYMWTARGSTTDTGLLVGGTDGPTPTFAVPVDIDEPSGADKHYYYTATIMVGGVEEEREDVTVTILEKPDISICGQRSYYGEAFEVSAGARVVLPYEDCPEGVRGAPGPQSRLHVCVEYLR